MKVLFVSSGNSEFFEIAPFIKSQGESLIKEGVDLKFFHIKGKGVSGYLKNVSKLREKIKEYKPDVVHSHYSLTGWVHALTWNRVPKVLSLMGSDTYSVNKEGKRTVFSMFMLTQVFLIQLYFHTIIVKSENLRKSVWRKKNVHVIPNGVNFSHFKQMDREDCRKKLNLPLDKKIVLFMGNTKDTRKNFSLLDNAFQQINSSDMLLCTPYPVSHKNVPLYLNACDVLVVPSFKEGSPNIVKEAMACNCPIVASSAGDIVDVISGTEGCYITTFEVEDMVLNLRKAIQFKGRTQGRKNIEYLNEKIIASRLIGIYNNLSK